MVAQNGFPLLFEITQCKYQEFGQNYCSHGRSKMIKKENSFPFEIACNEISSNDILVRSIRTPSEVLLKIALPEVVPQFGHADLLEGLVQWQRFGSLVDWNAVAGQVAKSERERLDQNSTHSIAC